MAELLEIYETQRLSTARPHTRANFRRVRRLAATLPPYPTPEEIARWTVSLSATRAPSTVHLYWTALVAVYRYAGRLAIAHGNPAAAIRWPRPRPQPRASARLLDLDDALLGLAPRQALLLGLCRYAGLRVAEACAVTEADVDRRNPARWWLTIERQRVDLHRWETGPTKTCRVQRLPIREELRALLAPVLRLGPATVRVGYGGGGRATVPFLCPFRAHELYGRSLMRRTLALLDPERLGRGRAYHVARHTLAAELLDNGRDLREIRDVLRHDQVAHTERYCQGLHGRRVPADALDVDPLPAWMSAMNTRRRPPSKHKAPDDATNANHALRPPAR